MRAEECADSKNGESIGVNLADENTIKLGKSKHTKDKRTPYT